MLLFGVGDMCEETFNDGSSYVGAFHLNKRCVVRQGSAEHTPRERVSFLPILIAVPFQPDTLFFPMNVSQRNPVHRLLILSSLCI